LSLIFEALKKLDREKQAPERGFLVVGASGWGAGRRAHVVPIAAALGAAGLAGFLFAQWAQRPKVETASGAGTPSASHPAPAATAASASVAPASVPPPTAPPATYLAPSLPAVRVAAPPAPPSSVAPRAEPRTAGPPPTQAAAEPPAAVAPTFTLQAVTERDGQPVAIVNGQLVRVGDTVEGAEVVRINSQEVELRKDGRRIVVSF
jgi:hypothetical protein